MLLSKTITDMLNAQINHEQTNDFKYKNVQAYFEDRNLNGFAKYFKDQAEGEHTHREKIIEYMSDKNAKINISIDAFTSTEFQDVPTILDFYYNTEIGTTQKLYAIVKQAKAEGDEGTVQWLYSFLISEQVEEEKSALDLKAEILDGWGENEQLNGIHLRNIDRRLLD